MGLGTKIEAPSQKSCPGVRKLLCTIFLGHPVSDIWIFFFFFFGGGDSEMNISPLQSRTTKK